MKLTAYQLYDTPFEIVPASKKRDWMDATNGFAYRCLPMVIANQLGWVIPSPVDFTVSWDGRDGADALTLHVPEGFAYIMSHFGFGIVTFSIPFLFRTPRDYGLIVRGVPNYIIPGVHPLDGFVETDWAVSTFTMNWKITEKDRKIHVKKGEPICMLQPYKAGELELFTAGIEPIANNPDLHEAFQAWADSRNNFNARTDRAGKEWQKDYFKGMQMSKLFLSPFGKGGESHE